MSLALAKKAVKDLITTNAIKLCTGLVHQGEQRQITMVSTSRLSPQPAHYSLYVSSLTSGYGKSVTKTTRPGNGLTGRRYDILIEIYDEAVMQFYEDQAFEQANYDFDLLVDRLSNLILETGAFTLDDGIKLGLEDPGNLDAIQRADLSSQWVDDNDSVGYWLVAQLRFSLRGNCASDLYQ